MKLLAKCITFIIFSLRRILVVNYSIFILQPKILRLRHKNTLPISHRWIRELMLALHTLH